MAKKRSTANSALQPGQPASVQLGSLNAQSKTQCSSFDPSATYFASSLGASTTTSIGKVHVKVWTCEGGELLGEVKDDRSESSQFPIPPSSQVTSLSWAAISTAGGGEREKGKRKAKSIDLTSVLFIGLSQGTVFAFSVKSASIFAELSGAHSGAISAVQVAAEGKELFTLCADGSIGQWSVQVPNSGKGEISFALQAKRSLAWAKGATKALSLPKERLLLCNQKIGIFSHELEALEELSGHATDVISAALSPAGALLATCAASDRFCMIWKVEEAAKLLASVPLESCCLAVGFFSEDQVWIEGEDGLISIYSLSTRSTGATIKFVERASQEPIPIAGLSTVQVGKERILAVARGLASAFPVFERISTWKAGANTLERTGISAAISGPLGKKVHDSAGAFDHTIPVKGTAEQPMNWSTSSGQQVDAAAVLAAFPSGKANEFEPVSIVETLHQAIKSRDSALLSSIILLQDERVIRNTVQRISPTAVIPFLEVLSEALRIGKTPLKNLLLWIQALISAQVGFFASSASASAAALERIYKQIEERTAHYNSLVGLLGKLDLVLGQRETADSGNESVEGGAGGGAMGNRPALVFGEADFEVETFEDCEEQSSDDDQEQSSDDDQEQSSDDYE
jgi:hypothetical protein